MDFEVLLFVDLFFAAIFGREFTSSGSVFTSQDACRMLLLRVLTGRLAMETQLRNVVSPSADQTTNRSITRSHARGSRPSRDGTAVAILALSSIFAPISCKYRTPLVMRLGLRIVHAAVGLNFWASCLLPPDSDPRQRPKRASFCAYGRVKLLCLVTRQLHP